ncbi:MAG TPA: tetratricopeptide repeat protein [Acidimicrobiia bacterium]|nr:tetratricopeptide repeat protein [Acidimicrobiia bacterium]
MAPRADDGPGSSTGPEGPPDESGEAYTRFQEGSRLLDAGNTHAAIVALERARQLEPEKGSIREALARAYYRTQRVEAARAEFEKVLELDPVNDYAHFGLGLCLLRTGDRAGARGHLKLASIMKPHEEAYLDALRRASA